ncbi:MAG: prephenate dehydratase [Deltaproteobacteria bacterium]|nr:prephenate dehydratase [Deltaproteobacteria bacterium]
MELKDLRKMIDQTDFEILKLLGRRMEFVLRADKLRKSGESGGCEESVRREILENRSHLLERDFLENISGEIARESLAIRGKNLKLAGFQGEHGAYGEEAARSFAGDAVPISCTEFVDVFDGVKNGQIDLGFVPVENSIEGAVNAVNDLLIETSLSIVGEISVPIHHCLLALPETDYREIKVVYSHPQALGQCNGFVARNKLEPRPYYDTAGAAMMLANERPRAAAAIASRLCADIYNLEILKENIEDHESNSTRFLVLARENSGVDGDKCSIVFSTRHKAGALFSVLKVFSDAGINLTRIESRTVRNDPRNFAFLLDFQGSDRDRKVAAALKKAEKLTTSLKFLGCYKESI